MSEEKREPQLVEDIKEMVERCEAYSDQKDSSKVKEEGNERKKTIIHLPKSAEGKEIRIRKLTPRECFRAMDAPEEKIDAMMSRDEKGKQIISNSQLYKLAGNSIVVSCMEHMFRNLFYGSEPEEGTQLLLF